MLIYALVVHVVIQILKNLKRLQLPHAAGLLCTPIVLSCDWLIVISKNGRDKKWAPRIKCV